MKFVLILLNILDFLLLTAVVVRTSFPNHETIGEIPLTVIVIAWLIVLGVSIAVKLRLPKGNQRVGWRKELFLGVYLIGLIVVLQFFGAEPPEALDKSLPLIWILLFFVLYNGFRRYKKERDSSR